MAMKDRKSIEEIQENLPLYQNFEQFNQVLEKINVVVSQETSKTANMLEKISFLLSQSQETSKTAIMTVP
jgi:hypothetical protein